VFSQLAVAAELAGTDASTVHFKGLAFQTAAEVVRRSRRALGDHASDAGMTRVQLSFDAVLCKRWEAVHQRGWARYRSLVQEEKRKPQFRLDRRSQGVHVFFVQPSQNKVNDPAAESANAVLGVLNATAASVLAYLECDDEFGVLLETAVVEASVSLEEAAPSSGSYPDIPVTVVVKCNAGAYKVLHGCRGRVLFVVVCDVCCGANMSASRTPVDVSPVGRCCCCSSCCCCCCLLLCVLCSQLH
jgi:hypothetical protein